MSRNYLYQAKDSVTGAVYHWTTLSKTGATGYPGPNTATELVRLATHGETGILGVEDGTASVTGTIHNYAQSGFADDTVHYIITSGSPPIITGFAAPGPGEPTVKLLRVNASPTIPLTIRNADTGSLAANRVQTPDGSDFVASRVGCYWLVYTQVFEVGQPARWLLVPCIDAPVRMVALSSANVSLTFTRHEYRTLTATGAVTIGLAGTHTTDAKCEIVIYIPANQISSLALNAAYGQDVNPFSNFVATKGYLVTLIRYFNSSTGIARYSARGEVLTS